MGYEKDNLRKKVIELENELELYKSIDLDDVKKLMDITQKMSYLLQRCRNEQIDYKLAQTIDELLDEL